MAIKLTSFRFAIVTCISVLCMLKALRLCAFMQNDQDYDDRKAMPFDAFDPLWSVGGSTMTRPQHSAAGSSRSPSGPHPPHWMQTTTTTTTTLEFPDIDIVYTWVNGSDPEWLAQKRQYANTSHADANANGENRYREHDEFKYSLRSVEKHAPWVRNIYIVVADGQKPSWLNEDHRKIHLVNHSTIFDDPKRQLPVFSGVPVEANLDRIPGLSNYFLYFNDDTFLGQTIHPQDFLIHSLGGEQKLFFESKPIKWTCASGCGHHALLNNKCNRVCNVAECGWDNGACGIRRDSPVQHELHSLRSGDFAESIKYTDGVFYRHLGPPAAIFRMVVRHVPHLINKHLMRDMKQRFKTEFEWTSSHRFRHPQDMQFAFSYFHHYVEAGVYVPSKAQLWRRALKMAGTGEQFIYGDKLRSMEPKERRRAEEIRNSTVFQHVQRCADAVARHEAIEFEPCDQAVEELATIIRIPNETFGRGDVQQVTFRLLYDNVAKSLRELNATLHNPTKFVTINDDMTKNSAEIEAGYAKLFKSLFPQPSAFEKARLSVP